MSISTEAGRHDSAPHDSAPHDSARRDAVLQAAVRPGPALFLDFDGTLVDIAERPEAVVVEPDLPDVLARLHVRLNGAVAIVTGRRIADIDRFLPGTPLDMCGLHGLELRIAGRVVDRAALPDLDDEIGRLRERLAGYAGVVVEDKRIGVAVHWRLAPDAESDVRAAVADLAERLGPGYRLQDGKSVREVVPAGAGKGGAVRELMAQGPYAARRPIFVGDDRTDEGGFEAANGLGGISVKIGEGETKASRRIGSPLLFRSWLRRWDETLSALDQLDMA